VVKEEKLLKKLLTHARTTNNGPSQKLTLRTLSSGVLKISQHHQYGIKYDIYLFDVIFSLLLDIELIFGNSENKSILKNAYIRI
jgi:hypothetical protein